MKRVLIVLFLFSLNYPAQSPNLYQQAKEMASAEHRVFERFEPQNPIPLDMMKTTFPEIFSYVPENAHQGIATYIEFLFPGDILQGLSIQDSKELVILKWTALGHAYNTIPFYSPKSGFFYFEQNNPNTTNLKGKRRDLSIKTLDENWKMILYYEKEIKEKRELLNQTEEKIRKARNSQEVIRLSAECQALFKEIENLKKNIYEIQIKRNNIETSIVQEYKIHLMPQGDLTPIILKLLEALAKDQELQQLIAAFKVLVKPEYKKKREIIPRVVIYATAGKQNAQELLNKIYNLFAGIPGLNERPRYNAKVTDLIWISQGDSVDKDNSEYANYYELPQKVYFSPLITGKYQNYHLLHPATGKEII